MMSEKASLGIIGGSGPKAGINVTELTIALHKKYLNEEYQSDKDAVNIVMLQDPGIGGPHGIWDLKDPNNESFLILWKNIINSIWKLHLLEVECFCIACNTLHYLEPRIREWMKNEEVKPTFISIIEVTKSVICKHQKDVIGANIMNQNRVAILGTTLITDIEGLSPYSALFDDDDTILQSKELSEKTRHLLQKLIINTKKNGPTSDLQNQFSNLLKADFTSNSGKTVEFIVLACTEFPLLLTSEIKKYLESLGIVIIDPNFELANEMLRMGNYIK